MAADSVESRRAGRRRRPEAARRRARAAAGSRSGDVASPRACPAGDLDCAEAADRALRAAGRAHRRGHDALRLGRARARAGMHRAASSTRAAFPATPSSSPRPAGRGAARRSAATPRATASRSTAASGDGFVLTRQRLRRRPAADRLAERPLRRHRRATRWISPSPASTSGRARSPTSPGTSATAQQASGAALRHAYADAGGRVIEATLRDAARQRDDRLRGDHDRRARPRSRPRPPRRRPRSPSPTASSAPPPPPRRARHPRPVGWRSPRLRTPLIVITDEPGRLTLTLTAHRHRARHAVLPAGTHRLTLPSGHVDGERDGHRRRRQPLATARAAVRVTRARTDHGDFGSPFPPDR